MYKTSPSCANIPIIFVGDGALDVPKKTREPEKPGEDIFNTIFIIFTIVLGSSWAPTPTEFLTHINIKNFCICLNTNSRFYFCFVVQ